MINQAVTPAKSLKSSVVGVGRSDLKIKNPKIHNKISSSDPQKMYSLTVASSADILLPM